jgi:hypothetical protein
MNINECIELAKITLGFSALAAALFSAWTAYRAYKVNLRKAQEDRTRDRDKELLSQIENSFKWAYESLTEDGKSIPPKADRLNWLTSARHLLRADTLSKKITSDIYRTILAEKEEFWRHRFYLALQDVSVRNPAFFENRNEARKKGPIEPRSAKVIIEFSAWKNGAEDPIDTVESGPISQATHGISSASMGFNDYLATLDQRRNNQSS